MIRWLLLAAVAISTAVVVLGSVGPAKVPGFDRSCGRGHRCVFGPAWSDAVNVDGGHNGCDTRNDVLRLTLRDVQIKPGTNGCVVLAGTLTDPYSGAVVVFSKSRASEVQVDHVFPVAQAWNRGAASWSLQARMDFSNDPLNLVVTVAAMNRAKSDKMPGQWSPPSREGTCLYVDRFERVASKYRLEVTMSERAWLLWAARDCASRP